MRTFAIAAALVGALTATAAASVGQSIPVDRSGAPLYRADDKKLIEFGWDSPTVRFIANHPDRLRDSPFDGVAFKPSRGDPPIAFTSRPLSEEDLRADTLDEIDWTGFDNSFLTLWAGDQEKMDWFDDERWRTITGNMELVSKAVGSANIDGVLFDEEFYFEPNRSPWDYLRKLYPGIPRDQVEAQVRQRGREFMTALQSSDPDIRVLNLYFTSYYAEVSGGDRSQIPGYADPLFLPFAEGMLEAAGPEALLIDGHEHGYYYKQTKAYPRTGRLVHDRTAQLLEGVAASLQLTTVSAGEAVYVDYLMGTFNEYDRGYSRAYRERWLQHNVYNALLHSDEYVWVYNERSVDWWHGRPAPTIERAIRGATRLLSAGRPLGYDMVGPAGDESGAAQFVRRPRLRLDVAATDVASGDPAAVSISATKRGTAIRRVTLFADARVAGVTRVAETDAGSGPIDFAIPDLPAGRHTLWARADRRGGGSTTTRPVTIAIAAAPSP